MSARTNTSGEASLFDSTKTADQHGWKQPAPDRPAPASTRNRAAANRRLYTITEAAELLGIGRSTAYELAQRGELEVVRIGGRRLMSPPVLERLLGERPPPPSELA